MKVGVEERTFTGCGRTRFILVRERTLVKKDEGRVHFYTMRDKGYQEYQTFTSPSGATKGNNKGLTKYGRKFWGRKNFVYGIKNGNRDVALYSR